MIPITQISPVSSGPVASAGRTSMANGLAPMPSMSSTILGWFNPLIVGVVSTSPQEDGTVKELVREIRTSGVLQPALEQKLDMQAGGARTWRRWWLHVAPSLRLDPNDRIRLQGVLYRVAEKMDYSVAGYIRYTLLEDYQNV